MKGEKNEKKERKKGKEIPSFSLSLPSLLPRFFRPFFKKKPFTPRDPKKT
jgi:hypothetical protein